ncbi:MAG: GntR family transcriptional regulator [Clostridiales bacterium]
MIKKETYSDQIYEEIKQDILNRRIGLGEKLINRELQQRYGVSSTPVRDAINRLYQEGFVEGISRAGARVINFDRNYAEELVEIIAMISDNAVKLSAIKSDRRAVAAELGKKIQLQQKHINNEKYYQHNKEFHKVFFKYAKNKTLTQLYDQFDIRQEIMIRYTDLVDMEQRRLMIKHHQDIYEAYLNDDILLARKLMEDHYLDAIKHL